MMPRLRLEARLSKVSWAFIELFTLTAVLLLPFSKSAAEIGILISLGLWALRKFPWDEPLPRASICAVAYLSFIGLALLSGAGTTSQGLAETLRGTAKWVKYFGIFFMSTELFCDDKKRGRLIAVLLFSAALVCADGFYQMITGADLVKHYSVDIPGRFVRMQGPFSSPNDLGTFLLFALPLAFFYWLGEKKWRPKSALLVSLTALLTVSFICTLSRSAFLALFLSAFFFVLVTQAKKTVIALTVTPLLLIISPMLRYNFFGSLNLNDITVGERLQVWKVTLKMIMAHPWLGNGINTYTDKFASFAPAGMTYHGYAHNCYLQMATEVGIPALAIFLLPWLIILTKEIAAWRASDRTPARSALLIIIPAFLVQSAMDTNFYALQASTLFWIFWGALAGGTIAHPTRAGASIAPVSQRASSGG